ncbi:hypothetical protein, partial [Escherichia coli]|uniref:hypothetical protein n=1 Tax=Escherichia coli TaxID=562 RepID=UPI00195FA0AB
EQVVRRGSKEASRSAYERREVRIEIARRGKISRRNHYKFRRYREQAGFERHEKKYPQVRKASEGPDDGFYQCCEHAF